MWLIEYYNSKHEVIKQEFHSCHACDSFESALKRRGFTIIAIYCVNSDELV